MVFAMSVSPFERGVRTGRARARHRRRAGSWSADNGRASSGDFHARSPTPCIRRRRDRTSVVSGKSVSVRVALGGRRIIQKKKNRKTIGHKKDKTHRETNRIRITEE